jgi:hypothetical protein
LVDFDQGFDNFLSVLDGFRVGFAVGDGLIDFGELRQKDNETAIDFRPLNANSK